MASRHPLGQGKQAAALRAEGWRGCTECGALFMLIGRGRPRFTCSDRCSRIRDRRLEQAKREARRAGKGYCTRCRQWKAAGEFSPDRWTKSGLSGRCKQCQNEAARRRAARKPRTLQCFECFGEFLARRVTAKYCSPNCAEWARERRKRERKWNLKYGPDACPTCSHEGWHQRLALEELIGDGRMHGVMLDAEIEVGYRVARELRFDLWAWVADAGLAA